MFKGAHSLRHTNPPTPRGRSVGLAGGCTPATLELVITPELSATRELATTPAKAGAQLERQR
jgi:hypothetical protein